MPLAPKGQQQLIVHAFPFAFSPEGSLRVIVRATPPPKGGGWKADQQSKRAFRETPSGIQAFALRAASSPEGSFMPRGQF
jgi:hypothetical protein